jgi:hypothetical protein
MTLITQEAFFAADSLQQLADLLNAIHRGAAAFAPAPPLWPLPVLGGNAPTFAENARATIYSWDESNFLVDATRNAVTSPDPALRYVILAHDQFAGLPLPAAAAAPAVLPSTPPAETLVVQLRNMVGWVAYARRTLEEERPLPLQAAPALVDLHSLATALAAGAQDILTELTPVLEQAKAQLLKFEKPAALYLIPERRP